MRRDSPKRTGSGRSRGALTRSLAGGGTLYSPPSDLGLTFAVFVEGGCVSEDDDEIETFRHEEEGSRT